MTIHTLPHFECIRLVSVRSSHLPFKMHQVSVRSRLPCINIAVRIELTLKEMPENFGLQFLYLPV